MTPVEPRTSFPHQLILFGSPGTGKSHLIEHGVKGMLNAPAVVKTVFHPEYTYGDFMGKLLPLSDDTGKISYRYYPGHFMQALALALKHWYGAEKKDVLLVIDEINRGNSAAIFGTAFQLLDRDDDGWSSYAVNVSDLEKKSLLRAMGIRHTLLDMKDEEWHLEGAKFTGLPVNGEIKLPPNLYIAATMNTSDESIYYMDSAFKRRWSWQYVPIDGQHQPFEGAMSEEDWRKFVGKLNGFIRSHAKFIRKVEDKQIGYYFIKARNGEIAHAEIENKLMFFVWDTVFARDKKPLSELLGAELVSFGDFANRAEDFVNAINARP